MNDTPGSRLKHQIELSGIRKKDFAYLMGIIPTSLSRILTDKAPLSSPMAIKAASILGIDPNYLLCKTDDFVGYDEWHDFGIYYNQSLYSSALLKFIRDTHMFWITERISFNEGNRIDTVDVYNDKFHFNEHVITRIELLKKIEECPNEVEHIYTFSTSLGGVGPGCELGQLNSKQIRKLATLQAVTIKNYIEMLIGEEIEIYASTSNKFEIDGAIDFHNRSLKNGINQEESE